ncbi:MAG: HAMP domain-containing histidine kinase [Planctomycetes bacterium]|nr:HAMP domain-containing histidine kinase [Planctomycetota bacterium]
MSRQRLALSCAAFVALFGSVFDAVLLYLASQDLRTKVRTFAEHESEEVAIIASRFATPEELRAHSEEFRLLFPEPGVLALEVWSPAKDLIARFAGPRAPESVPWPEAFDRVLGGEVLSESVVFGKQSAMRAARLVRDSAGPRWVALAVVDASEFEAAMAQYALFSVIGLAVLVVVSWTASLFLLQVSSRPVKRVITQARDILDGRSESFVAPAAADPELLELVGLLNRMLRDTRDSLARLKRFTSDAGHELRTPLARIRAAAEQALQKGQEAELVRALQSVLEETDSLRSVVDALLELARGESGGLQHIQDVNLRELTQSLVETAQPIASEKGVAITLHASEATEIEGNEQLLQRLLWNVIENATKFSPASSSVELNIDAAPGDVTIRIDDQGPGVPSEDLDRIFEPFYQSQSARSDSGGYGLGLTLARSIARRHGGDLWAERRTGSGLRLVLRLPRQQQRRAALIESDV